MAFLKNSLYMVGQGGIVRVFGFITTAVLSRILGPADFGIYNLVSNTANSVYGLVRLGTDAAITVFASRHHEAGESRQQTGRMLGAGLILLLTSALGSSIVCLVFSAVIAGSIFKQPGLQPWIATAALFVLLQCLTQFLYCLLVGFQRFPQYAKVMSANAAFGLTVTVPGTVVYGLVGAVIGLAVTQVFALMTLYGVVRKTLAVERIQIQFSNFNVEARKILNYGFPFYLSGLAIIPSVYYAQVLLAQGGGMEALGGLRVIGTMVALLSFVPGAIAPVILHRLSSVASGSRESFLSTSYLLVKYYWIFAVITGLLATLLAPIFIMYIFGEQYSTYVPAAYLAIFSSMFTTMLGVASNAAFSTGRVILILKYTVLQAVTFSIAAVFLVPRYGLEAYFIAEIIGQCAILVFLITRRSIRGTIARQLWFMPAVFVSMLYAVVVAVMTVEDGWIRSMTGCAGLLTACALIYEYVFEQDERLKLATAVYKTIAANRR